MIFIFFVFIWLSVFTKIFVHKFLRFLNFSFLTQTFFLKRLFKLFIYWYRTPKFFLCRKTIFTILFLLSQCLPFYCGAVRQNFNLRRRNINILKENTFVFSFGKLFQVFLKIIFYPNLKYCKDIVQFYRVLLRNNYEFYFS